MKKEIKEERKNERKKARGQKERQMEMKKKERMREDRKVSCGYSSSRCVNRTETRTCRGELGAAAANRTVSL